MAYRPSSHQGASNQHGEILVHVLGHTPTRIDLGLLYHVRSPPRTAGHQAPMALAPEGADSPRACKCGPPELSPGFRVTIDTSTGRDIGVRVTIDDKGPRH